MNMKKSLLLGALTLGLLALSACIPGVTTGVHTGGFLFNETTQN